MNLVKVIKIVFAISCQIWRVKYTKFDFSWGSNPDPNGGAYRTPPDNRAGFKGLISKGREGKEKRREGKVNGREGEGKVCCIEYTCFE